MKSNSNRKVLIARWRKDQDPSVDLPSELLWNDGSQATLTDFHEHMTDTHTIDFTPSGTETKMFPDVYAEVRYNAAAGSWMVYCVTAHPISLDLPDPAASDHQIEAQLSTLPTVYRATICRDNPVHK